MHRHVGAATPLADGQASSNGGAATSVVDDQTEQELAEEHPLLGPPLRLGREEELIR